jgi:selenide,water dikinase
VRGATDITGFSLLGHGHEMAAAAGVGFRLYYSQLPFTRGAREYAEEFIFPGGASDNRLYYGQYVEFDASIDEASQMLLFDPQTSGGLLLAVPAGHFAALQAAAAQAGQDLWPIGEVVAGGNIRVLP